MNWHPDYAELAFAHGAPVLAGRFKQTPADFIVEEELGFIPDGEGEHEMLYVEKTGMTTPQAQHALAAAFALPAHRISYAGLKDRQGITCQWFSLHNLRDVAQQHELPPGMRIVERVRNRRKLQRGSHRGNRFTIRIHDCSMATSVPWQQRVQVLQRDGVPNYFGQQRFGHREGNLEQAARWFAGAAQAPAQRYLRGMLLSAARSFIFNAVLSERVANGSWNRIVPGDVVALAGSAAVFAAGRATADELQQRLERFDIHPTGPLWGEGKGGAVGEIAALEEVVAARYPQFTSGLARNGLRHERRPLRVQVADMTADLQGEVLTLRFRLVRGAYATAVLRELVHGGEQDA